MKQSRSSKIICLTLASTTSLLFAFPLFWLVMTSFKSYKESFAQPPAFFVPPDFTNYAKFLGQNDVFLFLRNSIVVTLFSVIISMVFGVLASYVLTRSRIPGRRGIGLFMLASRFIPPVSTLIPIYLIYRKVGLYDTCLGLILLNCAMNIPYVIWMMRSFIHDVPESLEESAWIDGCGRIKTFLRIVLPLCRSGIAATAVLIMVFSWNEYLFSMMLTSTQAKTLPLSMMMYMGEAGIEWNMMATAGVVILIPTVFFSILTHRNLGSGMSFGAVKG